MSYRNEYRSFQRDAFWTLPRAILAALAGVVAVFLLIVLVTPLTIGLGWYTGEANLRSFQHVRATYTEAYDDVNALDALARQSCRMTAARARAAASGDENAVTQRDAQLLAIENRYDSLKGEYDAYMSDHFRGGIIRPRTLPMPFPVLDDRRAQVCA